MKFHDKITPEGTRDVLFEECTVRQRTQDIILKLSLIHICQNAEEDILKNPVYTILNLCRVLAYQKETLILSKKSGGLWALRTIPSSFSALVGQALHCYESDAAFSFDPKEMARFAAYMLAQLKKPEGDFQ